MKKEEVNMNSFLENTNHSFSRGWEKCHLCNGVTYEEHDTFTLEHSIDCLECGYYIHTSGYNVDVTGFHSPSVLNNDFGLRG